MALVGRWQDTERHADAMRLTAPALRLAAQDSIDEGGRKSSFSRPVRNRNPLKQKDLSDFFGCRHTLTFENVENVENSLSC